LRCLGVLPPLSPPYSYHTSTIGSPVMGTQPMSACFYLPLGNLVTSAKRFLPKGFFFWFCCIFFPPPRLNNRPGNSKHFKFHPFFPSPLGAIKSFLAKVSEGCWCLLSPSPSPTFAARENRGGIFFWSYGVSAPSPPLFFQSSFRMLSKPSSSWKRVHAWDRTLPLSLPFPPSWHTGTHSSQAMSL